MNEEIELEEYSSKEAYIEELQPTEGLMLADRGDYYEVTGYNGRAGEVFIPSTYSYKPLKVIGESAFYKNMTVTGVTISDGVTDIGKSAFSLCKKT